MKTPETLILKVHTDSCGKVWYSDGIDTPREAWDQGGFVDKLAGRDNLHVRMLGMRQNALLIAELYCRYCSPGKPGVLEVASPLVCGTARERSDPEIALYRMRQCLLPPSLGGWHRVTDTDYPSYALAALQNTGRIAGKTARRLLLTHPAWYDLSFIPTICSVQVAQLLAQIIDPRWYIDQQHSERLAKLRMALGLTPATMRRVTVGNIKYGRDEVCRNVLNSWQGKLSRRLTDDEMKQPANFLWRRWFHAGGGWKGNLRASQDFVTYLIRTWQQQIVAATSAKKWDMFLPESLLRDAEVLAYKEHAKARVNING